MHLNLLLQRLNLDRANLEPNLDTLVKIHEAMNLKIPYENLDTIAQHMFELT